MYQHRTSVVCTILCCCCLVLISCSTSPVPQATATPGVTKIIPTPAPTQPPLPTPTPTTIAPKNYTMRILLQGMGRPDDLAFDPSGHLLFSDFYAGTISRLNSNGTVTVLVRGIAGPEGIVVLTDGKMIIAEQRTNRILTLAPNATSPTVLRQLPGTPGSQPCKDGVDGIALDAINNTLIIPDSPTGEVYRLSLDGKSLSLLASGIVRPVGAVVDAQGNVYVADECGGALWRIAAPNKPKTRFGQFGMLDDVVLDTHGNVLVTDLQPSIHSLIRMNLATGQRETLLSKGLIEPQGLVIDAHDNIFVSDDYANLITELCAHTC
jgi:sugar lactone lactonase YvrE